MRLSGQQAKVRNLTLDIEGEPLHVAFRWGKIDSGLLRQVQGMAGDDLEMVAALLDRLVVEWDLTDEEDQPIPFTAEALTPVPIALLVAVIEGIVGAARPNATTPQPSGSFS